MRPASHSSGVLPFMERLLAFFGKSAEDNVLDGFITRQIYVFNGDFLVNQREKNGDELSLVRVADNLNCPLFLQKHLRPLRYLNQVGDFFKQNAEAVQPVEVEFSEVDFVVREHSASVGSLAYSRVQQLLPHSRKNNGAKS